MRTMVCYGDSNTYGFDPSDYGTGRYPKGTIWTDLLERRLAPSWRIVNEGLNGRRIPYVRSGGPFLMELAGQCGQDGLLAVMLGTNDLLMSFPPDAERAAGKMKICLDFLVTCMEPERLLLIAPPLVGDGERGGELALYCEENLRLNGLYKELAEEAGVHFLDAGEWHVPMAYDGVHLSEEGHASFAEHMADYIRNL